MDPDSEVLVTVGATEAIAAVTALHPDVGRTLVRFAFCKRPEVLDEAIVRRLSGGV